MCPSRPTVRAASTPRATRRSASARLLSRFSSPRPAVSRTVTPASGDGVAVQGRRRRHHALVAAEPALVGVEPGQEERPRLAAAARANVPGCVTAARSEREGAEAGSQPDERAHRGTASRARGSAVPDQRLGVGGRRGVRQVPVDRLQCQHPAAHGGVAGRQPVEQVEQPGQPDVLGTVVDDEQRQRVAGVEPRRREHLAADREAGPPLRPRRRAAPTTAVDVRRASPARGSRAARAPSGRRRRRRPVRGLAGSRTIDSVPSGARTTSRYSRRSTGGAGTRATHCPRRGRRWGRRRTRAGGTRPAPAVPVRRPWRRTSRHRCPGRGTAPWAATLDNAAARADAATGAGLTSAKRATATSCRAGRRRAQSTSAVVEGDRTDGWGVR